MLYAVVAVEVAALTGSYWVWNKLNLSQGKERTRSLCLDFTSVQFFDPNLPRLPQVDV